MRTGWEIVIAGRGFDPSEFFKTALIQPSRIWSDEVVTQVEPEEKQRCGQKGVEFSDFHDGPYPLDMATEALDYLMTHRDEFEKLCRLPGIEERRLNFIDTLEGHGGMFHFDPSWIVVLAELKFSINIDVLTADVIETNPPK